MDSAIPLTAGLIGAIIGFVGLLSGMLRCQSRERDELRELREGLARLYSDLNSEQKLTATNLKTLRAEIGDVLKQPGEGLLQGADSEDIRRALNMLASVIPAYRVFASHSENRAPWIDEKSLRMSSPKWNQDHELPTASEFRFLMGLGMAVAPELLESTRNDVGELLYRVKVM